MALIVREILNFHDYALEQWRDPRVDDWFLMSCFWNVVLIVAAYLYFVLNLGPKIMENRKPVDLDKILIIYNAVQVIYCAVIVTLATIYILPHYNLRCEPCDYSMSFTGVLTAKLTWFYFFLKIIDLLDTVFFVLRKKNNQITFLHVYHHGAMVLAAWIGVKFFAGGSGALLGYLNSIVHIFMYSYYLHSVIFKNPKNQLWWKKRITQIQLVQFGLLMVLFTIVLVTEDCGYPKWLCVLLIPQNLFMFVLFTDFYIKAYGRQKNKQTKY